MRDEWVTGQNQFKHEREILLSITDDHGNLIGMGGSNVDPYADNPSIGRVRHVYIAKAHRSSGTGKVLLGKIITHARDQFKVLRLRTHNPAAVKFYLSLGFKIDANPDNSQVYLHITL